MTAETPVSRGRRPWWGVLQGGAIALVLGLLALLIWRIVKDDRGGARVVAAVKSGKKPLAPSFDLPVIWNRTENWPRALRPALRDGRIELPELRGYPVVLNFWASWCAPCRDEAPRFEASARAHRGRVVFLGVDAQDLTSDARSFARKYGLNYVSVRDGGGAILSHYGVTGFPETYFLDSRGRIVVHNAGEVSRSEIEEGIAASSKTGRPQATAAASRYLGSKPPVGLRLPPFRLRSYRRHIVDSSMLSGKAVLVTFLDTACTEACPLIAGQIGAALPLLSPAQRTDVEAVALSVQPKIDTPQRVRRFLEQRRALGLDFLVGPLASLRRAWRSFYVVSAAETGNADTHSADVRIFDRRGVWVSTLRPGVDLTPANLAHDLRTALERS